MSKRNKTTTPRPVRAAIVALSLLEDPRGKLTERQIAAMLHVPRSTVSGVVRHVLQEIDQNGGSVFEKKNLDPDKSPGRPKKLSQRDIRRLCHTATRNRAQRNKD